MKDTIRLMITIDSILTLNYDDPTECPIATALKKLKAYNPETDKIYVSADFVDWYRQPEPVAPKQRTTYTISVLGKHPDKYYYSLFEQYHNSPDTVPNGLTYVLIRLDKLR